MTLTDQSFEQELSTLRERRRVLHAKNVSFKGTSQEFEDACRSKLSEPDKVSFRWPPNEKEWHKHRGWCMIVFEERKGLKVGLDELQDLNFRGRKVEIKRAPKRNPNHSRGAPAQTPAPVAASTAVSTVTAAVTPSPANSLGMIPLPTFIPREELRTLVQALAQESDAATTPAPAPSPASAAAPAPAPAATLDVAEASVPEETDPAPADAAATNETPVAEDSTTSPAKPARRSLAPVADFSAVTFTEEAPTEGDQVDDDADGFDVNVEIVVQDDSDADGLDLEAEIVPQDDD